MLTWLASYPKSGSTWVRAFLAAYRCYEPEVSEFDLTHIARCSNSDNCAALYTRVCGKPFEQLSDLEVDSARSEVQRYLAKKSDSEHVVKTHNARVVRNGFPLIDQAATARAVYVVRNPLDIVDSLADHAALSIDDSISLLANRRHQLGRNAESPIQFIDSWSEHVKSWTQHQAFPVLIIRYEEMLEDGATTFSTLVRFLQWEMEPKRLSWAIEQTRFNLLQQKEAADGFVEVSKIAKSGTFFRHGRSDRWPMVLTRFQAERIINDHGQTMRLMGYAIPDLDQVYASPPIVVQPSPAVSQRADVKSSVSGNSAKERHLFIPVEWKRWIAENLLLGRKADELVRILVEKGYPESLSRLEVDVAESHPYIMAAKGILKNK